MALKCFQPPFVLNFGVAYDVVTAFKCRIVTIKLEFLNSYQLPMTALSHLVIYHVIAPPK